MYVEHHKYASSSEPRDHVVQDRKRLPVLIERAAGVPARDAKARRTHGVRGERQADEVEPVASEEVDVLLHIVVPQLVNTARGLEASPVGAFQAKWQPLRVALEAQ